MGVTIMTGGKLKEENFTDLAFFAGANLDKMIMEIGIPRNCQVFSMRFCSPRRSKNHIYYAHSPSLCVYLIFSFSNVITETAVRESPLVKIEFVFCIFGY